MQYFVYILANNQRTVIYTGVTNDLVRRVYEHKNKLIEGKNLTGKIHISQSYKVGDCHASVRTGSQ